MKRVKYTLDNLNSYPEQIILKRFRRGIYYQGKPHDVPEKYYNYLVLERTDFPKYHTIQLMIVEEI